MVERIRTCPDVEGWERRLLANSLRMPNGCLEWTGPIDARPRPRGGYGKFRVTIDGRKRMTGAHRAAWLVRCGDIPGDLMPDHLCRNSLCIDVEHMELVTNAVNGQRGDHSCKKGRSGAPYAGPDGHACRTHEHLDGYLHVRLDGYLIWVCRICARARSAAYQSRQRAA